MTNVEELAADEITNGNSKNKYEGCVSIDGEDYRYRGELVMEKL